VNEGRDGGWGHPVPGLPSTQVFRQEFAAGTLAGFELQLPEMLSPSMAYANGVDHRLFPRRKSTPEDAH